MLLRFIIKPTLLRMLNNPDSLEDLEIASITPIKRMPGAYRVTVFYRAENAFGGVVAQRQSFLVTKGAGTGINDWMNATPVKN